MPIVEDRTTFIATAAAAVDVAFQPIAGFDGRLRAVEALVRGADRMGCFGPPDLFARAVAANALFEFEALIADRAMSAFRSIGGGLGGGGAAGGTRLFLNLHGALLCRWTEVAARLERQAVDHGLCPADICIELSEANQVLPVDRMAEAVAGLRAPGFGIAIDDFGTGLSGLHMLYRSDPDYLKIDRVFIQNMPGDAKKRLLVASIVELAHTLGIRVIAEGIETDDEIEACRGVRCDLAQGYRIARPTTERGAIAGCYDLGPGRAGPWPPARPAEPEGRVDLALYAAEPPTLPTGATLAEACAAFRGAGEVPALPVLGPGGRPLGLVCEQDLRPLIYAPDDAVGPGAQGPVRPWLTRVPVIERSARIGPVLDLIAADARHGLILTDGGVYRGHVTAPALARLAAERRIAAARRENPLTGLPGNETVAERLEATAADEGIPRLFASVDLDGMRAFNDRYGYDVGDRAILICADALTGLCRDHGGFLGHVGGDDFVLVVEGAATGPIGFALDAFAGRYGAAVRPLHRAEDRARGWMPRSDGGEERRRPLLSCTVVAVDVPMGVRATGGEVQARLAALRMEARAIGRSTLTESWAPAPAALAEVLDLGRRSGP